MEITWTSKMSVYNKTIDNQHKKLFKQLNSLKKELSSFGGVNMGPLRQTISFFDKYANEHLKYEESYMEKHQYPDLDKHKKIHDAFRKYFEYFKEKFHIEYSASSFSAKDIKKLVNEADKFLADWWVNHVLKEDHKYAEYIKSHSK